MIDRSIAPSVTGIDKINILPIQTHTFSNGLPLYFLHSSESEIVQLSFFFKAGWIHQHKKLLTNAFTSLLTAGTLHHSSKEITEWLEQYGVFYNIEPSPVYTKLQFTLKIILNNIKHKSRM